MKPSHRKWVLIPGILIAAAALAGLLAQIKPEPEKEEDQNLALLVDVVPLEVDLSMKNKYKTPLTSTETRES